MQYVLLSAPAVPKEVPWSSLLLAVASSRILKSIRKDPSSIKFLRNDNPNIKANPFKSIIPKPNWTVTYNGLSRMKGLDKIFTNVTIRHGYHSTLSMNSFNTALLFTDPFRVGFPYFRDPLTGNYIPYFLVPNITIAESFDPLIEVDLTQGSWYQFVFIGEYTSRLYEVRMYDWNERQVVFQQKRWGEIDGNVISYSYIPKFSEYHMMKPVQVNKQKKKNLCGYVMLFKKATATENANP